MNRREFIVGMVSATVGVVLGVDVGSKSKPKKAAGLITEMPRSVPIGPNFTTEFFLRNVVACDLVCCNMQGMEGIRPYSVGFTVGLVTRSLDMKTAHCCLHPMADAVWTSEELLAEKIEPGFVMWCFDTELESAKAGQSACLRDDNEYLRIGVHHVPLSGLPTHIVIPRNGCVVGNVFDGKVWRHGVELGESRDKTTLRTYESDSNLAPGPYPRVVLGGNEL